MRSYTGLLFALDESAQEIRLIHIPMTTADDISRAPSATYLSERSSNLPPYVALSYVWGDPKITERISVNGLPFLATKNLVQFLHNYSHIPAVYSGLPPWINAICINQADINERNLQVRLMGQVYRKAITSISWLRPKSEQSDLAAHMIRECAIAIHHIQAPGPTGWLEKSFHLYFFEDYGSSEEGLLMPRNKAWTSVVHLFSRPYWERTWTYQELVLAGSVVVLCGASDVALKDIILFVEWICSIELESRPVSMAVEIWHFFTGQDGSRKL